MARVIEALRVARSIPGIIAFALCTAMPLHAASDAVGAATVRELQPGDADLQFAVDYLGITRVHGRFPHVRGSLRIDPTAGSGQIDVTADAAAVSTGIELRDAVLRSAAMFDTAQFPEIRFHSTAVTFVAGQVAEVAGALTLHGVTRPVTWLVQACAADGGPRCPIRATLTLRRSDYGVRYAALLVGDAVDLVFTLP